MKKNFVVEVPLSAGHNTINLAAPCTYCGEQVVAPGAQPWEHKETYTLKHWAHGQKSGTMQLWDLKIDGEVRKGNVTVCAPYCAQHTEGVELFTTVRIISVLVMLVAAVIALVLLYAGPDQSMWDEIGDLFVIGGLPFVGFWSGLLVAWAINTLIALIKPEFRDYPTTGVGHWGLSAGPVRVDSGGHGVGPVRYFLPLGFLSVESAQRFLAAYPTARVTKGAKLIAG